MKKKILKVNKKRKSISPQRPKKKKKKLFRSETALKTMEIEFQKY